MTRLEQYAACAYAHFLMYGLKLSEREQYEFAPVDMGNIFHETLEAFSKKLDASDYTWKTLPREVADEWVEECLASLTVDYGNTVSVSYTHLDVYKRQVLTSEALHVDQASATAVVLLIIVIGINAFSGFIAKKLAKKTGEE